MWIDDGKIGAQVESLLPEGVLLRITHARPKGEKLRPDKGINFPDSLLNLSPLTSKDRRDLDFVAAHADMIGYSFVQKATDIELLQLELQARLGATRRTPRENLDARWTGFPTVRARRGLQTTKNEEYNR